MMRHSNGLASFVDGLEHEVKPGEVLELVIAGDFVDFLAIPPYEDFTSDPKQSVAKLNAVAERPSVFSCAFDSLARHVKRGHRLTVLLGNHDLELALPAVQTAFLNRIQASPHNVLFVTDGRAYRVGRVLIEHGNSYDRVNANDWDGLRNLCSTQSRATSPDWPLLPSAGSQFVKHVINELKERYPFINLLQPEGELLALLLLAFEPELCRDWSKIVQTFHAGLLVKELPQRGVRPIATQGTTKPALDKDLLDVFGEAYTSLATPPSGEIGALGAWVRAWRTASRDGLRNILTEGRTIPPQRLNKLRVALQKLLSDDTSNSIEGPTGQYGKAAERLLVSNADIDVVIMGHTHLPRLVHYGKGTYLNIGTWIDRVRVPPSAITEPSGLELTSFLRSILEPGGVQPLPPMFAELQIDSNGRVVRADLRSHQP